MLIFIDKAEKKFTGKFRRKIKIQCDHRVGVTIRLPNTIIWRFEQKRFKLIFGNIK